MTDRWRRRLFQTAVGVALAGVTILVTEWAFPAGHLAITIGHPYYSRTVGETSTYVTIDIRIKNVGADAVQIDREHFLLIDDQGRIYRSDPSTQFVAFHAAATTILPLQQLQATMVFRLPAGRTVSRLLFVTTTGEIVRIKLS